MASTTYSRFIRFLQDDLAVSDASIAFAERVRRTSEALIPEHDLGPLPMILWQYGFVTIEQLDRIFDWLETAQGY